MVQRSVSRKLDLLHKTLTKHRLMRMLNVLKNNPEKLEASYGKLVPVLVKAVQELSAEIKNLKKEIENGK
jgi:hypothetical protein